MPKARIERYGDNGQVAELILDGPPLNLFDNEMLADVTAAVRGLAGGGTRAVLFRAEGKHFCAGVDVHEFQNKTNEEGAELMVAYLSLAQALEALPVPVLAVVHGLCLTIGMELSLGCDLLWAADNARFGLIEATVGLTPGGGGTQRMVARAGAARAAEFVLTGGIYDAATMLDWGVANKLLPAQELLPAAREYALKLAAGPTTALAAGKRIIAAASSGGVAAGDAITPVQSGTVFTTTDMAAGIDAVLAKKPGTATFIGS